MSTSPRDWLRYQHQNSLTSPPRRELADLVERRKRGPPTKKPTNLLEWLIPNYSIGRISSLTERLSTGLFMSFMGTTSPDNVLHLLRPSQITTLSSQNVFSPEPPLQLRTVRRKRIEVSPEKTDAQKRLRHNKASAPEKCLMSVSLSTFFLEIVGLDIDQG